MPFLRSQSVDGSAHVLTYREMESHFEELRDITLQIEIEGEEDSRLMTKDEANEAGLEEEFQQYEELKTILDETSRHTTFINDSYFADYIKAQYIELYPALRNIPGLVIDWTETASKSERDYDSVEFDGSTFHYQND